MISTVSWVGGREDGSAKSTSSGLCFRICSSLMLSSFSITWSRSFSLAYRSLFLLKKSRSVMYSV